MAKRKYYKTSSKKGATRKTKPNNIVIKISK